jgi:hypothetical protein
VGGSGPPFELLGIVSGNYLSAPPPWMDLKIVCRQKASILTLCGCVAVLLCYAAVLCPCAGG